VVAAGALWGCIGLFLKLLTAGGCTSVQSVLIRCLTAMVFFLLWILRKDRKALKIHLKDSWYFIGTGIFSLLFFNWCYFNAIQRSSMAVAAVLLYTAPIFVMLMSAVLFHETITGKKCIALVCTVGGCILVTGVFSGGEGMSRTDPWTILYGLGAGIGYALYSVFGTFALRKYSPSTVTFYTLLFATLGALPLAGVQWIPAVAADWRVVVGGLGIGIVSCLIPYLLYTEGLRQIPAGKASILATVEPVVASLIGVFLFREEMTGLRFLGILAILGGVLLVNWQSGERG